MITQAKTTPDELKIRVLFAKRLFPPYMPYMPAYEIMFGDQSPESKTKIRNVWNARIADEEITVNLEKLAASL